MNLQNKQDFYKNFIIRIQNSNYFKIEFYFTLFFF